MERIFPFKNITVNSLIEFTEGRFLNHFFWQYKQNRDENYESIIENNIRVFRDSLSNFENEILQTITTTNQDTIDYYFKELHYNVEGITSIKTNKLKDIILQYNANVYKSYLEEINKESEEYFKREQRDKYKHLEEYEDSNSSLFHSLIFGINSPKPEKTIRTNYNFFCVEKRAELIDTCFFDTYFDLFSSLVLEFLTIADKYIQSYNRGEISVDIENFFIKTNVSVEGLHDVKYINKAAELLNKRDTVNKIELINRGGFRNLDKIWNFYSNLSWETIPQKKILLYDCDTNKQHENFGNYLFKRTVPTIKNHIVGKGIENLFSDRTIEKAKKEKPEFFNHKIEKGTIRGKEYYNETIEVNENEKTNFCNWICENGTAEDFQNFEIVFGIIEEILNNKIN